MNYPRITLAATVLAFAATCARADGVQDSLEACRQLQDGPLPITCSVLTSSTLSKDNPTFLFGFLPNVDSNEATLAVASVVLPICQRIPVVVVLAASDGRKITRASAALCSGGEMGEFKELDPATMTPRTY